MDRNRQEHKENSNGSNSISNTNGNSISSADHANHNGTSRELTPEQQSKNLFLSTFEKPTQIYRYLRTRHYISPVFLHRNLSYMKQRMSRNHSKRDNFDLNTFVNTLRDKKMNETKKMSSKFGNLLIKFMDINSKSIANKSNATIVVSLLKMSTKNPNSLLQANNETLIGECKLTPDYGMTNKITISKDNFVTNLKHLLIFKVITQKSISNYSLTNGTNGDHSFDSNDSHTSSKKRRRLSSTESSITYKAELDIFGANPEGTLKDGEYYLTLKELNSTNGETNGEMKFDNVQDHFKKIMWRSATQLDSTIKDFSQEPFLKFYLSWSSSSSDHDNNNMLPSKPYSIKNTHHHQNQTPLKQIDPPNTEINGNGKAFSKNSNIKQRSFVYTNSQSLTNGHTNGFNNNNNNNNSVDQFVSNRSSTNQTTTEQSTTSKVIYRFWFNNLLLQQTKAQSDFKCPWCGLNCLQMFSLKHHLKFCHNRFNFTISFDSKGYKVDVTINEFYDGSYDGNPQQDLSNFSSTINGPVRRTSATLFLINLRGKAKSRLIDSLDNESIDIDFIKPHIHGHNRLYYHSGTCQPIKPHELDYDSEDEIDPEWMRIKTQLMIDEFTDVNEGEKEIMKLWNLHMMKYNFVGGVHVPIACEMFVKENWREIISRNIYMNFILHLNNLFDYGLLTSGGLRNTVKMFNEIKEGNSIEN